MAMEVRVCGFVVAVRMREGCKGLEEITGTLYTHASWLAAEWRRQLEGKGGRSGRVGSVGGRRVSKGLDLCVYMYVCMYVCG